MLKVVRERIESVPKISFDEFYLQYMCDVQDSNIDMEFDYMVHRNTLNIRSMESLIKNTFERLDLNDYSK